MTSAYKSRVIIITTGDNDGVGLEITLKSLKEVGPKKNILFVVFLSSEKYWPSPDRFIKKFNTAACDDRISLANAIQSSLDEGVSLLLIKSNRPEAHWVDLSARYCIKNPHSTMLITGPLSKQKFISAGLKDIGHTGLFRRLVKNKSLFMGFIGEKFSVVLMTDHIPLKRVSDSISLGKLKYAIRYIKELKRKFKFQKSSPIHILGINPHAGDCGLIGKEELRLPGIKFISADSAFTKKFLQQKPIYLAMHHDQGLIPFKMAHDFDSGVHITLGLPFLRLSVDHGPAVDIFGSNRANCGSMLACIKFATKLNNWN